MATTPPPQPRVSLPATLVAGLVLCGLLYGHAQRRSERSEIDAAAIDPGVATRGALSALPGLGPTSRRRLLELRAHHPWSERASSLRDQPGFSDARLHRLAPFLALDQPQDSPRAAPPLHSKGHAR